MDNKEFYETIKSYKLTANKSLGQNFLIDNDVALKIVSALKENENDTILEIGTGLGSLTYQLAKKSNNITSIDVDENMINIANTIYKYPSNVVTKRENALKCDVSSYDLIIGNLPYYITSGIIEYLLLNATNAKRFVLMVQKEVYYRLIDKKEKSPLSLLLSYVGKTNVVCNVTRNAFAPVPHVDSLCFVVELNEFVKDNNNKLLYKLMCALFLYRRKNILNCLTNLVKDKAVAQAILSEANILENIRPEALSINEYKNLLKILNNKSIVFWGLFICI